MSTRVRDPFSCFIIRCVRAPPSLPGTGCPASGSCLSQVLLGSLDPVPSLASPDLPSQPQAAGMPRWHSGICAVLNSSACHPLAPSPRVPVPPAPLAKAPFQAVFSLCGSCRVPQASLAGELLFYLQPRYTAVLLAVRCSGWYARDKLGSSATRRRAGCCCCIFLSLSYFLALWLGN